MVILSEFVDLVREFVNQELVGRLIIRPQIYCRESKNSSKIACRRYLWLQESFPKQIPLVHFRPNEMKLHPWASPFFLFSSYQSVYRCNTFFLCLLRDQRDQSYWKLDTDKMSVRVP